MNCSDESMTADQFEKLFTQVPWKMPCKCSELWFDLRYVCGEDEDGGPLEMDLPYLDVLTLGFVTPYLDALSPFAGTPPLLALTDLLFICADLKKADSEKALVLFPRLEHVAFKQCGDVSALKIMLEVANKEVELIVDEPSGSGV